MDQRFAEAMRRAGFSSKDALARELKARVPGAFASIEARGLAAKIGELERGKSTWWQGHPERIEALRELTRFDAGELLEALEKRSRGHWSFPEFSTLPPMDLLEELPADLGAGFPVDPKSSDHDFEAWMQRALPPSRRPSRLFSLDGVTWLTMPPGCGRGLLLARLQAIGSVHVVTADTLDDAVATAAGSRPVVLAPRRAVRPDDMEALLRLDPERPVLIVSANACPRPTSPSEAAWHPRWDWLVTEGSERRRLELVSGNLGGVYGWSGDVRAFEWRLAPDWRRRLVGWLERRLAATGDTLFSRQGLDTWLQRFDPASIWFSTPADVMALASLCHASGERKLPNPDDAQAGARLLRHLAPMDSRTSSLLLHLLALRWRDAAHEWLAPLTWDDWLGLIDSASREIAYAESGKAQRKRPPTLDLETLRQEGFLAVDSRGWWAFAQPAQARLMLRDALMRWVSEGDIERWARPLIGDASRQAAVDSVLAAMPRAALDGSLQAVLSAAPNSLSALSATEALFVALGRKFGLEQAAYAPELADLPARILRHHADACGNIQPPFTRAEGENCAVPLPWLLACWEWSLCAPAPAVLPPELATWFPGWLPRGDDAEGAWYSQLPQALLDAGEGVDEVRAGFDDAVRSAQRVVDRVGVQGLVGFAQPGPLWAALMLVSAGRGQVSPESAWWEVLMRLREAPGHLIRSLERDDADAVAMRLLPSFLEVASGRGSLSPALAILGPIWIWLFDKSRASRVLPGLPEATVFALYRHFRGLPAGWQAALTDRLGPNDPAWCWERVLAESRDPEALAEHLLAAGLSGAVMLPMLWRLAPSACLAVARDSQHDFSALLISLCPGEQCGQLAGEIARRDDLLPDRAERLGWVLRHLRESRGQEQRLRALLNRLEIN